MQLVEQHIIKKSNPLYKELDKMCLLSKNLYNQSLYRVRQYYFENKKYLTYANNVNTLTQEQQVDYISLPRKVSQWVCKQVDNNFKSFFASLKLKSVNHKVRIPQYLDKNGRNILTFTNQAISQKERTEAWHNRACRCAYRRRRHLFSQGQCRTYPKHKRCRQDPGAAYRKLAERLA